jgi:hypothetical protein
VWASWAVLDRATATVTVAGGAAGTNTTESMVKVAIAADLLGRRERAGRPASRADLAAAQAMIVDSDNDAAERTYRAGGRDAILRRVITRCALTETTSKPGWWSETQTTAADAARLGACIADARLTSPASAAWLLAQMQAVRGVGRFGLVAARPTVDGQLLAIKNGWTWRDTDGLWHVNCLAVAPRWSAAVLLRYDGGLPLEHGGQLCAQLMAATVPS